MAALEGMAGGSLLRRRKSNFQKHLDNTFKAAAIMLPHQILNVGRDIPPVNVFGPGSYVKRGFLMKLEMSSQPLGQRKWRRRFCILTLDKMFLYEDEKSRGYEKHSEVIQLSNFQRCQRSSFSKTGGYFEFSLLDEERRQNSRKTTNRFFHHVTSSKSIVTFGVNELTEAEDWILAFQQLLNRIQQPHPYVIDDGLYAVQSIPSKQMATRNVETLRGVSARGTSNQSYSRLLQQQQPSPKVAKELTYSYSSSEEESTENDESSLHGSFGGSAVVTEALTIRLTPRSSRANNKSSPSRRSKSCDTKELIRCSEEKDFNEIKTLQEEESEYMYSKATHAATVISDTSSGSCITEVPNTKNVTATDQIQQHLGQISAEVTKLQNLCTSVENEFVSTKNDMGNLQENLTSLQKVADHLDSKLVQCVTQMKSTERQAAILLNELRIKSEVLDRKIVEVEELKSELLGGGNSRNKHLLQAEASNGYKTFPEKRGERGGNSSTTTKNVKSTLQPAAIKPTVKQAINRKCTSSSSQSSSSSNRHSVQICQDPSHGDYSSNNSPSRKEKRSSSLMIGGVGIIQNQPTSL